MLKEKFLEFGEYAAAGLYEECDRSLFYRKALGLRRYLESCELAEYNGERLYPSGAVKQKMKISMDYLNGFTFSSPKFKKESPELSEKLNADFCVYKSTVPEEHSVAGNMYTHSMPHYERILREGFLSYVKRVERIADADMREGLLHLIEGIKAYVLRCVEYLKSVGADEELIAALTKVPLNPASNSYEAILSWNFVMYLDNCDNLGCLAKGLLPYYKGENLIPLLENLYDNLDKNDGYSMSLDSECPALTIQCLKAAMGRRRPMIELFVDESTPEQVWQTAFEVIKSGGGQPAFYNSKALLGGLQKRFPNILDEDIGRFCGGGCTESMIAGLSCVGSLDAGINLLLILEKTIYSTLTDSATFSDFYSAYLNEVRLVVEKVKREISNSRVLRAKYNPLPMRTLLIDDCIERATEYNSGGARYNWSIINFAGLINVIDSLLVIRDFVYEKRKYTAEELVSLLKNNDSTFLLEAAKHGQSFGKDIDEVNAFAHAVSEEIFKMTDGGTLAFGEGFLSASIQFMSQVLAGKGIGATPDGRSAGAPLADSLAAIFGKDTYGPTALLNSVNSLDLKNALGVPVVNLNLNENYSADVLKALILGYMKRGGIQLQITCVDKETLLDADAHPEKHENLMVRVGGFSEYFVRLTPELRRMVINRTIQKI